MIAVRRLGEGDLPEAQRIVRRAFGTFLEAPDLDSFWTDFDYVLAASVPNTQRDSQRIWTVRWRV